MRQIHFLKNFLPLETFSPPNFYPPQFSYFKETNSTISSTQKDTTDLLSKIDKSQKERETLSQASQELSDQLKRLKLKNAEMSTLVSKLEGEKKITFCNGYIVDLKDLRDSCNGQLTALLSNKAEAQEKLNIEEKEVEQITVEKAKLQVKKNLNFFN